MQPSTFIVWRSVLVLGFIALGAAQGMENTPWQSNAVLLGPAVTSAEPIAFPDGVIDADLRTAFVSSPAGGIQAIRLDDGVVLWTNDECLAQPSLTAGPRLLALGDRLFVLDLKNGKVERTCDAPAYPKLAVPDRCIVSFQLWAPRVTGDTLEAHWFAVAHIDRSKGRPFPFAAWTAFNKAVPAGTAQFDLTTGRVVVNTDAKPVDVTGGLIPEVAKPERRLSVELPDKLAAIWKQYHASENGRVIIQGERMIGVAMTLEKLGSEYNKRIVVSTWNVKTGMLAGEVEVVKDKAINIAHVAITEDRRHAAVVFGTSALAIYTLADGKLLARDVKGVRSPEKIFIDGKRLYYTELAGKGLAKSTPYLLKALDLDIGKVVWERSLKPRNTLPLPP